MDEVVVSYSNNYLLTTDKLKEKNQILYHIIKRLFDICVGLVGVMFLIPISVIIKIISIKNKDYNKIFFTQERIGKDGKLFKFYKFRSMVPNADEILFKYLEENEDAKKEYEINKKLKDDPRITKVGKIIRKCSIDELPQLINILKGDMSLIGNRPYLPREKEDMTFFYNNIVKTKPGLTGYWQVSGRSNLTFRKRLELESYYSRSNSLLMDTKIFFKTFEVVLFKHGAK